MEAMNGQRVKMVADAAIFNQGNVLLVTYTDTNRYDHQTGWFLPDGLVGFGEHPDDAVRRVLADQLGAELPDVGLSHIESFGGNDGSWHLVFHYRCDVETLPEFLYGDDVARAEWFAVGNLPDVATIAHHGWAMYTIREMTGEG